MEYQKNIGVIIVWNLDFYTTILENLSEYTIILEKKVERISLNFTKNLLREIHFNKKWWDDNIEIESKKRYFTDSIIYLVVTNPNIHDKFKQLKYQIRDKYKIDKNYFHFSDPDCENHLGTRCKCKITSEQFDKESIKHLNLLQNDNSLHFLKCATFNKKFKFNIFLKEYIFILKKYKLNIDDYCIDNGGILSSYGLRDAHDLDYLTVSKNKIKNRDIGCENKNHEQEYKTLGYTIEDIIKDPKNHFYHYGVKFMSLEILKKFKFNRTKKVGVGHTTIRKKDLDDYDLILNKYNKNG